MTTIQPAEQIHITSGRQYEEEQLEERRCHLRVQSCCCCCPITTCSAVSIAIIVVLEFAASAIAREWINAFLQLCLLSLMIIVLCAMRQNEKGRLIMYQAYGFVLLLNLIELVAMSIVYFGVFDVLEEVCEEFQLQTPDAEIFQFNSVAECEYNMRMMLIAIIGTGSLIYFPMKVHFMLVLRSFWKHKRDFNETVALQELQKQMDRAHKKRQTPSASGIALELSNLQKGLDEDQNVEVVPGLEVPETARKGLIEPELDIVDQHTQGTMEDYQAEDRKQEDVTPYEMQRMQRERDAYRQQEMANGVAENGDHYDSDRKPEEVTPYERGAANSNDIGILEEVADFVANDKDVRLPEIQKKYKKEARSGR